MGAGFVVKEWICRMMSTEVGGDRFVVGGEGALWSEREFESQTEKAGPLGEARPFFGEEIVVGGIYWWNPRVGISLLSLRDPD